MHSLSAIDAAGERRKILSFFRGGFLFIERAIVRTCLALILSGDRLGKHLPTHLGLPKIVAKEDISPPPEILISDRVWEVKKSRPRIV